MLMHTLTHACMHAQLPAHRTHTCMRAHTHTHTHTHTDVQNHNYWCMFVENISCELNWNWQNWALASNTYFCFYHRACVLTDLV